MDHDAGDSVPLGPKEPCPDCGGRKCLQTYTDGHSFCFKCEKVTFAEGTAPPLKVVGGMERDYGDLLDPGQQADPWAPRAKRGLKVDTLKKYGVFSAGYSGGPVVVYPYYSKDDELVAQKLRTSSKEFPVLKGPGYTALNECRLFGHHVYGDKYDRQVVVLEGEEDALAVAQELGFKVAVVSVNGGAGNAAKSLKANYLWLDRFTDIVFWFDLDEEGQKAIKECAPLFKVGKVRVAKAFGFRKDTTTPCKDASDMLQAGRPGDILTAIYSAGAYRPPGIVNAARDKSDVLANRDGALCYDYPPVMEKLQEMTGGMYPGDVVYHVAGTGVGKSTQLREIMMYLVHQDVKIAYFSFEDTKRDAKLGLMSIEAHTRLGMVPEPRLPAEVSRGKRVATPEEQTAFDKECDDYDKIMGKWHELTFGGGMVELFDPETAEWTMDAMLGYIRYCVKALGVWAIFIDPMSFLTAGLDLSADERRVLDKIAAEIAKQGKELGCHIQIAHHLKRVGQGIPHEEGAPTSLNELRSSGGLANFATAVVGWERNNQAADDLWRVTQARIIKPIRRTGRSGLADLLYFGDDGRLIKSPHPMPKIGKPDGGDEDSRHGGGGFKPDTGGDY
ncbi:MAG: toprim domain-containing protein [Mesorhizobium sp.]|uniref:bifunctional DNA primase/helicase n=1 Tax=Mesorhizobium sp. TaxID=1871066 RepID=UPI000FE8A9CB|nr:DnaB-like helicase C-terminal domain-containing protein [Mesorhizobium sp.]RWP84750.1 MAG: toprim domain-containing protein [Mesorhizobium sp.]